MAPRCIMSTLEQWARKLKRQVVTLSFALSHPRTPLLAKLVAGLTLLYAISPIDLIPDFIPVLASVVVLNVGQQHACAPQPRRVGWNLCFGSLTCVHRPVHSRASYCLLADLVHV